MEFKHRNSKITWLTIDVYGIKLGSSINDYPVFSDGIEKFNKVSDRMPTEAQEKVLPPASRQLRLGQIDKVILKKYFLAFVTKMKEHIATTVTNRAAQKELTVVLQRKQNPSWNESYKSYVAAKVNQYGADLNRVIAVVKENGGSAGWPLNSVSLNKEARLLNVVSKGDLHGWNGIVVAVGRDGTIEAIQLLKFFDTLGAMSDFVTSLENEVSRKYAPAQGEKGWNDQCGYYVIYGTYDADYYRAKLKDILETSLKLDVADAIDFDAIPYIINSSLDSISLFYDETKKAVCLTIKSNDYEARVSRANRDILYGM